MKRVFDSEDSKAGIQATSSRVLRCHSVGS